MAPWKIHNEWVQHGWWISAVESEKPMLSITEHEVIEGRHWSALAKIFGQILAISSGANDELLIAVTSSEVALAKYRVQRRLLMAPIPPVCLAVKPPLRGLKPLHELWTSMPEGVKLARTEAVERFVNLDPENILRARRIFLEHTAYDDLRNSISRRTPLPDPPRAPEETDPVYGVFAKAVNVNWVPVAERNRRRHLSEGVAAEDTNSPSSSTPRRVRPRNHTTSEADTSEAPVVVEVGGVEGPLHGSNTLVAEEHNNPSSTGEVIGSMAPHTAQQLELPLGSTQRVYTSGIPTSAAPIMQSTTQRRTGLQGRPRVAPSTRASTRGRGPRRNHDEQEQDMSIEEREDIDVPSDVEGTPQVQRRTVSKGLLVVFPSDEDIWAGYVWGMEAIFQAPIDHIRNVQNVETNHRCLTEKRVRDMYQRIGGKDEALITPLTLRPIAYILEDIGSNGERQRRELPFPSENAAKVFDAVYSQHGALDHGEANMNRISWLENNVIWEPIDGQHIVAACKQAQQEHATGVMTDQEFSARYGTRRARFMVFNNPKFYIEASVRINAKEFERDFYTTMYEDLVKLRAIWSACGKPNADVRADDPNRGKAIAMAASALHWTVTLSGQSSTLKALAKRMVEYTRHAWQENEECYAAALQVCKDYEEGMLWYSKDDEKRWKEYAKKHSLDPNVDVRVDRKRMERLWLRPLSRVPSQRYLRLAKEMAAKPVVDGRRQSQKYYFNSATSTNPPKYTLAWVVDRIQRREAVRNAIRWLLVESGREHPESLAEFFTIDVERFGGEGAKQFQELGGAIDKSMKKAWATPAVRSVTGLEKLEDLIPPIIKQHYTNMIAGGRGYQGYRRDVADISEARWDWEVNVPCMTGGNDANRLPIRCRGGFFEDSHVELGEPCLWIFDCRRSARGGDDEAWGDDEFRTALQQLQRWMTGVHRWNAIFLFPAGTYFDEEMRNKIAMPHSCTWLRGVWMFQSETLPTYVNNLMHGGQLERSVQALGDVAIMMDYPSGSRPLQNVRRSSAILPLAFEDRWNEGRLPRIEDRLERSPTELHRLVQAYLPEKWGLVVMGITTAIADIVHPGFVGSQVIILDGSPTRTRFLYNTLQTIFGGGIEMPHATTTTAAMEIPHTTAATEAVVSPTTVPSKRRGRSRAQIVDSSAEETSDEERSGGNADEDAIGSAGEELHSQDTPVREGRQKEHQNSEDDSDDATYHPGDKSASEDGSASATESHEGENEGSERSGDPNSNEEQDRVTRSPVGPVAITSEGEEVAEKLEDTMVESEATIGEAHEDIVMQSEDVLPTPVVGQVNDLEEVVGPTPDEPTTDDAVILSTPLALNSNVLSASEPTMNTQAQTLSFGWAFAEQGMNEGVDGYFYDGEGIRYRRIGEHGQYRYEQVTSIMEGEPYADRVPLPITEAMVTRVVEYVESGTPSDVRVRIEEQRLDAEDAEEIGTQSSEVIPETPQETQQKNV